MRGTPLIAGEGLWYAADGKTIIEDVSLSVGAGEIVTLIGPNGAGKTSLLRLLLGLEPPLRGRVWRKAGLTLGYLPQRLAVDPTLPITLRRFLDLPRRRSEASVAEALAWVGLEAETVSGKPLQRLSGGEFQRALLARALLGDPELLVLDEPAQAVDHAGQVELYRLIARLREKRGCSVLVVSHDLHLVMAAADRVLCLNRHICCSGAPEAVRREPAYLSLVGPRSVDALAIYHHEHDHTHGPDGRPLVREAESGKG